MNSFGTILRFLREEKGLTQEKLAEYLGISKSTVGMYELGKREPDFETMEAIADCFNVNMDYLLGRSPDRAFVFSINFDDEKFAKDSVAVLLEIKHLFEDKKNTRHSFDSPEWEKIFLKIQAFPPNDKEEFYSAVNEAAARIESRLGPLKDVAEGTISMDGLEK